MNIFSSWMVNRPFPWRVSMICSKIRDALNKNENEGWNHSTYTTGYVIELHLRRKSNLSFTPRLSAIVSRQDSFRDFTFFIWGIIVLLPLAIVLNNFSLVFPNLFRLSVFCLLELQASRHGVWREEDDRAFFSGALLSPFATTAKRWRGSSMVSIYTGTCGVSSRFAVFLQFYRVLLGFYQRIRYWRDYLS